MTTDRETSASPTDAWTRYRAYLRRPPERVVEWVDGATGARGWLVINSLRGGAAGGGTRMRRGLDIEELTYLAKTMELKFAFAGPPIGGAKSGIDFDPGDPRKPDVLARWFRHIGPHLKEHYATGGDLNVDEVSEVIPGCRAAGVRHPQEGVVQGHFHPDGAGFHRIIGTLDRGVRAPLTGSLAVPGVALRVSDVGAGHGVGRALARLFERRDRALAGARVMVEGFGAVGAAAALELARAGARIVAVSDAEKTLIDPGGLDADGVGRLIADRINRLLPDDARCARGPDRSRLWDLEADIFVAAAISDSIDADKLEHLERCGVSVIACGANHPFKEERFGVTALQEEADRRFAIIPDVVGSAGAACTYSYLMREDAVPEAGPILDAVDRSIAAAMDEALDRAGDGRTGLLAATLAAALDRIGAPAR